MSVVSPGRISESLQHDELRRLGIGSGLRQTTSSRPTVVWICSPSFSGSTMLDLMLGHGPEAFSCGEVGFWYRPVQREHLRLHCSCQESACGVWQQLLTSPEKQIHRRVTQTLSVRYVIDSTKRLSWVLDGNRWATLNGLLTRNVVIWKSPQLNAYSWWKRGKPIAAALDRYIRYYRRLAETGLPCKSISYEALVEEPESTLKALCEHLGMEYFSGKEHFWKQAAHLAFGNSGTRETLESFKPAIRSQEVFPAAFEECYFQELTSSHLQQLREVVSWLRQQSVHEPSERAPQPANSRLRYPLWYYGQIWQSRLRKWTGRLRQKQAS